jgi:hypothetical protein
MPDLPTTALTKSNPCPNVPRAGVLKGKPCLRPEGVGHAGACVHDPEKLEATIKREVAQQPIPMTDQEIIEALTAEDIRQRSAALEDAESTWDQVRTQAMPKILCPQCNGNGKVTGGSLGEFCDRCNGQRMVQDLTVAFDFAMPDFASLRGPIARYGDAHALRAHGVKAALPARSSVPTMETIEALVTQARTRARELGPGQAPPLPRELPSAAADDPGGIEDTATDAELVEFEGSGKAG